MPAQVALAASGMVAYTDEVDEFECKPKAHIARPSRPLDYVIPPSSADWPKENCEGREELCQVLRDTAVNREVMVAVCNSAVINQLSKWVDANRRAKISNMMIVSIDERLPKWLNENKVAYWLRVK